MSSTRLVICSVIFNLLFISGVLARDPRRGPGGSTTLGGDIFLQGKYLEVGINPAGSFGSRNPPTTYAWGGSAAPAGYHPSVGSRIGIVVDWDKNGWNVGNPAQSGDFVLEGTGDIGYHISWQGKDGAQIFNQMPLFADDDDLDSSYTPPRGCTRCKNGLIPGCVDFEGLGICNCPPLSPTSYTCPYLRWDMTTTSFEKVDTVPVTGQQRVKYVGKATGSIFSPPNSGYVVNNGENVTVTRELFFNVNDTFIVEELTLTNSGNSTIYNISALWHIQSAPEASPNNPNYMGNETDFESMMSIPYQGANGQSKVLVQSRSKWNSMTASLGTLDEVARAHIIPAANWSAPRGDAFLEKYRPYSASWVYEAPRSTQTERSRNAVMTLANRRPVLAPGNSVTFRIFHAFTPDAVTPAFAAITVGCDGVAGSGKVYDACGVCGGTGSSCAGCDGVSNSGVTYDACGVCGGNGQSCLSGCDHAPFSTKSYDICGVCGGNGLSCLSGCDNTPFSKKTYDACGVCGGTGSTCNAGCDGVPNSGKVYDVCGVCDGNGQSCLSGCDNTPFSKKTYDVCGVCGGTGSTCNVGCDGVPNSGKKYDACGVCDGNGLSCLSGCDNAPFSTKTYDSCGVCGGNGQSCLSGCDHTAYSTKSYDVCGVCGGNGLTCLSGCDNAPFSTKSYDACGVCGGNGQSCLSGCDHAAYSTKSYDACGVCDGNGQSCLSGCDHAPFSTKTYDSCGVCGGTDACLGCDKVAYSGAKLDACGLCKGDNSTCKGCDGVPNSGVTYDACGVCGGKNTTCQGCDGVANSGKSYDECGVCGGVGKTCSASCTCPTCDNCNSVLCPSCDCDFHGYSSSNLDFLIYRYEALNEVEDSLGELTDILREQLTALRVSRLNMSSKLSSYQNFIECGLTTDTLLRFYFNLAQD